MSLAFSLLQEKFSNIFSKFSGQKTLSPEDIDGTLRSIRLALLDADVALPVIKTFIGNMKEKLTGQELHHKKQDPQGLIMALVQEELLRLLEGDALSVSHGENTHGGVLVAEKTSTSKDKQSLMAGLKKTLGLAPKHNPWSTVMMVGLQGNGKTTMSAKLAYLLGREPNEDIEAMRQAIKAHQQNPEISPEDFLKNHENQQSKEKKTKSAPKKILLVSLDTYRPGAQEQLQILAQRLGADSLPIVPGEKPLEIAKRALQIMEERQKNHPQNHHVVIFDTAGRLQCDDVLMEELRNLKSLLKPDEIFFVADALLGQQGLTIAKGFHDVLNLTGVCLSKTESDSRCGIVLSLRSSLGLPIKLMGTGENPQDVSAFDPQSIVGRLLDQGDIMGLMEKATTIMTKDQQEKSLEALKSGQFTLDHLAEKLRFMEKMGGISSLMQYIPGMGKMKKDIEEKAQNINLKHQLAMISSMTPKERKNPSLLTLSRRKRVAKGSGTTPEAVQELLQRFNEMKKIMTQFKGLF